MRTLKKMVEYTAAVLIALAISINFIEIILRVFFNASYDFIIQASVWLTVWAMLLMLGPVYMDGGHVSLVFIRQRLGPQHRRLLDLFNAGLTAVYGLAIAYGGVILVQDLVDRGTTFPLYWAIPMWIVQIIVPIGMILFSLYALSHLYEIVTGKDN